MMLEEGSTASPFDDEKLFNARSALIQIVPDDQGRYEYKMACQYTRSCLNQLQVGDLIGVENYVTPGGGHQTYSVLSLTQALPIHFAAAQGMEGYPGHVFESMRSIKEDWETQKDRPLHLTTTIALNGVSTGWQFGYKSDASELPFLSEEQALPMVGAEIRPLSLEMVEAVINYGISDIASPLYHKKFTTINVLLDRRALLTTHFGIFGFTNTGKSNLTSSMVSALISHTNDGLPRTVTSNVVVVDPNDEYLGLFIDHCVHHPDRVRYIHVGADSLPAPIVNVLMGEETDCEERELELLYRQMKLPLDLKRDPDIKRYILLGLYNILKRTSIVLPHRNLAAWIRRRLQDETPSGTGPAVNEAIDEINHLWAAEVEGCPINDEGIDRAINYHDQFNSPIAIRINRIPDRNRSTGRGIVERTVRGLQRLRSSLENVNSQALLSLEDLIQELTPDEEQNESQPPRLVIITARREADIKEFAATLGNELYENRRVRGIIEPFTLLLLDEADLFIPLDTDDGTTRSMKETCVTFARRGRKFGLGLGIATQRAAMLDTQVMGNLHTYFVSKLPRKLDRERVAEAFGIGEEQLSPTFTFQPGHWLIISHDATGLKGVPIPVKADNANQRILNAAEAWRRRIN